MNKFQMPIQLINMLKGGNPQQILSGMIQQNTNNPMMQNLVSMMNDGDSKGIEQLARNLCQAKGVDPDEMLKQIQEQFR